MATTSAAFIAIIGIALCIIIVLIAAVAAIILWRPRPRQPVAAVDSGTAPIQYAAGPVSTGTVTEPKTGAADTPLDILNKRLASGEITIEQYREIKQIIAPDAPVTPQTNENLPS